MKRRIYSFSVKEHEMKVMELFKTFCDSKGYNFSAIIVKLIKEFMYERRQDKSAS